jgi:pyrroloquinoline-quinone synthase
MEFFTQLETVRDRWNVLQHPFYQRWSAGELTREELATYAGQYRHAVVALADASTATADVAGDELQTGLRAHAAEETAHIDLWDAFTAAVGGDVTAAPTAETAACAAAWAGDGERPLLRSLAAMYAIESGQPAISETKTEGLVEHYGFAPGSDATRYFELHAVRDIEHAAHERDLLEARLQPGDADALLEEAEAVLRANWELLDGVERLNGREPALAAS